MLERKLPGDVCFALRDCDQATALNPKFPDAHFFRCRAVDALGSPQVTNSIVENGFSFQCCVDCTTVGAEVSKKVS